MDRAPLLLRRPAFRLRRRRTPSTPRLAPDVDQPPVSRVQRRSGRLRQRCRRRHRERRSAHEPRGQLSRRRQVVLEPQERRGPRQGQCRRPHPRRRQADRRECRPHRHAARRHDRQSAGRARERRPHRREPRRPQRQRHHARQCDLLALPGDQRHRLPETPELGDHRGAGDRRPRHHRVHFEGGRLQLFGINLPLLPVFNINRGTGGATGWLVPDISVSTRKGLRARLALPLAARAQPRSRRLRRTSTPACCRRSKPNIASSTASARSSSAAS